MQLCIIWKTLTNKMLKEANTKISIYFTLQLKACGEIYIHGYVLA